VRRYVFDTDKPGVLVADEMCLEKTSTVASAAMICKLVTEKVVMGCHCPFNGAMPLKSL
jgi:hypothetical protein